MRVLLATGSPDLGHALSLFLSERSIHVVDVVGDLDHLLERAEAAHPDVVLVDWRLGEAAAGQTVADLMDRGDPTPVIILSTAQERSGARDSGAAACCTLGDHPDSLLAALHAVGPGPADDAGDAAGRPAPGAAEAASSSQGSDRLADSRLNGRRLRQDGDTPGMR
jgi:DNA-binding response OmpR family regulator